MFCYIIRFHGCFLKCNDASVIFQRVFCVTLRRTHTGPIIHSNQFNVTIVIFVSMCVCVCVCVCVLCEESDFKIQVHLLTDHRKFLG